MAVKKKSLIRQATTIVPTSHDERNKILDGPARLRDAAVGSLEREISMLQDINSGSLVTIDPRRATVGVPGADILAFDSSTGLGEAVSAWDLS